MNLKEAIQDLENRISRREGLRDKLLRKRKTTKAFYRDLGEFEGAIGAYGNCLTMLVDLQKTVETPLEERTIKLWLVNTKDLPLILRVQAILGLHQKQLIGETQEKEPQE